MIDGIGVCTVCAKVCHANCDVTYSKYGSFFCDCGDKEDGSCKALTRRSPPQAAAAEGQTRRRRLQQHQREQQETSSLGLQSMLARVGCMAQGQESAAVLPEEQPQLESVSGDEGRVSQLVDKMRAARERGDRQIEEYHVRLAENLLQLARDVFPALEAVGQARYSAVGRVERYPRLLLNHASHSVLGLTPL